MFKNIGKKIKILAIVIFACGIIGSVFGGCSDMVAGISESNADDAISGLAVVFFGPILTWISSILIYGFGQLIDNSDKIAEEMKNKSDKE